MKKLSIIVPVFNEEKTLPKVLKNLQKIKISGWKKEIIIVNDGSTDSTGKILKKQKIPACIVLTHQQNKGKGYSIQTALKKVTGNLVIVQDADLEYDPQEISKLLKVYEKEGGLILGSRNLKPKRKGYVHYVFGVWILTKLTNMVFHSNLTDTYTCYKLISVNDVKSLKLKSPGFEIEMEMIAKALKNGMKITEVPISYSPRSFAEGKKINWKDGLIGVITLLKYRIKS